MKWNKVVYYNIFDCIGKVDDTTCSPYSNISLKTFTQDLELSLTNYPIDLENANVEKLWIEVVARYHNHPVLKKTGYLFEEVDIEVKDIREWAYSFLSLLSRTYEYYNTLLTEYNTAKNHLMDTIKASSSNKVTFNDTPQNDNSSNVYEGDDYITHFTKSNGTSESDLQSKIMRLKEIQDNFKQTLNDWVSEFERLFFEEVQ